MIAITRAQLDELLAREGYRLVDGDAVGAVGGAAAGSGDRGLRLVKGSEVRTEPVEWLYEGRIPLGNVTLIAGTPGGGKTTLLCEIAARISRGQLAGAFLGHARDVILLSGEDSIQNTLVPRCEGAGADLERVHFVKVGDEGLSLPDDLERVATLREGLPELAMLGVDPLMAFIADRVDSHKDHSIRRTFSALRSFADAQAIAIPAVAHLNKSENRDFLARIGGSVGIGAAVRSALAVAPHPEEPEGSERVLVHVKSNLGPEMPTLRFRVESRTTFTLNSREIATSGIAWLGEDATVTKANVLEGTEERSRLQDAVELLHQELADGSQSFDDLRRTAERAGVSRRTLERAKGPAGVKSVKETFGGGWRWALKRPEDRHISEVGGLGPQAGETPQVSKEHRQLPDIGGLGDNVGGLGGPDLEGLDYARERYGAGQINLFALTRAMQALGMKGWTADSLGRALGVTQ